MSNPMLQTIVSNNIGLGINVFKNTTTVGISNIGIGGNVFPANSTGKNNIGIGGNVFVVNTNGQNNIGIGNDSGTNIQGSNNTMLGSNTGQSGSNNYNNSTAIGYGATVSANNQIVMGTVSEYVTIPSTISSTNATTGALTVSGNLVIGGDVYLRGNLSVSANVYINNQMIGTNLGSGFTTANLGTNPLTIGKISASTMSLNTNISSTNTTTGTVVAAGGICIGGNVFMGGNISLYKNNLTTTLSLNTTNDLTISGNSVIIKSNIVSTSITNGSLVVGGGVGIGGNTYLMGNLFINGNIFITKNNPITTGIANKIIVTSSASTGTITSGTITSTSHNMSTNPLTAGNISVGTVQSSAISVNMTAGTAPLQILPNNTSDPTINGAYVYNSNTGLTSHAIISVRTQNVSTRNVQMAPIPNDSGGTIDINATYTSRTDTTSTNTVANTVNTYCNGTYYTSTSGVFAAAFYYSYYPFNNYNNNADPSWSSTNNWSGGFNNNYSTSTNIGTINGPWLQIQFPYSSYLTSYAIRTRGGTDGVPKAFYVAGSTNGSTWVIIDTQTNATQVTSTTNYNSFTVPTTAYNYYRLILYQNYGSSYSSIIRFDLSGNINYTGGGNPFISWDVEPVSGWSMGIDNSDSQKLKIANYWVSLTTNTKVTIANNGNFGINTTAPAYLLDVNGQINATNYSLNGSLFTMDGTTSTRAAPSAKYIQQTFSIYTNGVYWIQLPTVGAVQIYCIMDTAYAGGGWMLALKATRGTTFPYSSTYWTDKTTTLNPTQYNRNDGDAKFHTFNYFPATDWMALWPDAPVNGGDIPLTSGGWSWVELNAVGTTISCADFFARNIEITKSSNGAIYTSTNPTPTNMPKFSTSIWSTQNGFQWYGMNYKSSAVPTSDNVRWGFGWNNEADQLTNDARGGIGLSNATLTNPCNFSAGDHGDNGVLYVYTSNITPVINSNFNVFSFTSTGNSNITFTYVSSPLTIYYLAVGGGGSGGSDFGAGGGGGAVVCNSFTITQATTINITVGTGGVPTTSASVDGTATIITYGTNTITAGGGFSGPSYSLPSTSFSTAYGGSGGGGAAGNTAAGTYSGTKNNNTYFNVGGSGTSNTGTTGGGGGGGGAGGVGGNSNATAAGLSAGTGGAGLKYSSIGGYNFGINNVLSTLAGYGTSSAAGYLGAGGGGGGLTNYGSYNNPGGTGGSNGAGGAGASNSTGTTKGSPATVYGGAGGGGAGATSGVNTGGNGYQGLVILAFQSNGIGIKRNMRVEWYVR